jgi:LPXTG-site transpeptidase (sortase) family protein
MARLGTALLVCGLLAIAYGAAWQLGWAPGSRVTLPAPVALQRTAVPTPAATSLPTAAVLATPAATIAPTVAPTPLPAQLTAADLAERRAALPRGYATRLAIPSIKLDTVVEQAGVVADAQGNPTWQTLPFVAVHYGDLTAPLGVPGNAVIAGHVVTLSEGNVFRFLYQLDIDDEIDAWDQLQREHTYHVTGVKLVPPEDTSVMDPTPDETLTLITCGGTFDPVKREFSARLIVTATPVTPSVSQ